jgi:DNA (cytosine-5)-methyltransferase 1
MATPVTPSSPDEFSIVDLFAGPGGLDVAAKQLRVPAIGLEWDEGACETRVAALLPTIAGDVRDYGPRSDRLKSANVLAGGPPCQTFTVAGHGSGRRALDQVLDFSHRLAGVDFAHPQRGTDSLSAIMEELSTLGDPRTGLVLEPLRWALQALADGNPYQAIVLEQVRAVLPVWKEYAEILRSRGYAVAEPEVLHTEEFGVPQTRSRAILIARWAGAGALLQGEPALPAPTHQRFRTGAAGQALDAQIALDGNQQRWVQMNAVVRRGQKFEVISNYGTGGNPKARGRRRSDEPSATVTGKISRNRIIAHDGQDLGRFHDGEAGQLQTFPADYPWRGKGIAQQIGNAVPPRLGVHVLAAALDLGDRARDAAIGRPITYAREVRAT